jgi:hypothetical protein
MGGRRWDGREERKRSEEVEEEEMADPMGGENYHIIIVA